jgi:hypothetical protein
LEERMTPKKPKEKEIKRKKKAKSLSRPAPPKEKLLPESLIDVEVVGGTVPQWRTSD